MALPPRMDASHIVSTQYVSIIIPMQCNFDLTLGRATKQEVKVNWPVKNYKISSYLVVWI